VSARAGATSAARWPLEATTSSPEGTRALAAALAPLCRAGDVVLLVGDLGAGKTVFAQGFAGALGVAGPVTSPTFALVRHYRCGPGSPVRTLIHADVYRTGSVAEVADLALGELVEEDAVALVEWGDKAAPALGDSALEVTLAALDAPGDPQARTVSVVGRGRWSERVGDVAVVLEPVAGRAAR
jgi:tRNA threonylcarbamoyladenosine biosynthesis protein TsaE